MTVWAKTKNLFSVDPADPLADQNLNNTNMVGATWGSGQPASSKEDSAVQRITLDTIRKMIRRNGQSGLLARPTFLFSAGYPANSFHMPKADAYLDGLSLTVVGSNLNSDTEGLIQLPAPPVSSTRLDLVFLECWLAEVPGSTASLPTGVNKPDTGHVFKWGNVTYGGTNPIDDINEVNVEIRRRVQVQYRFRVFPAANFGLYPNGVNDPANAAQGPQASVTALPYAQSAADPGLYVAGNGTVSHQSILGTLDGFVYAIPIAKVLRTSGVTIVSVNDVTDLRLLWGGSSGTIPTLSGDNVFTGRQQFAKGADLAPAGSVITVGTDGNMWTVNGAGPFTGISPALQAGVEVDLLFPNPVNLVNNNASFILPFKRIYRTVANELMTFKSLGGGNYICKGRSGPGLCVGTSIMFNGSPGTIPEGFVLEYKQSLLATTFEGLLAEYLASGFVGANIGVPGAPLWSTFTANAATDEITINGHGKVVGDVLFFANASGSMPGGLGIYNRYYVVQVTGVNTFKVSATRGGAALDITSAGSGTLNAYDHFYAGDMNGRVAVAADNMGGTPATRNQDAEGIILGAGAGEWKHLQLITEMAAHSHAYYANTGTGTGPGTGNSGNGNFLDSSISGQSLPFNIMQPYQTKLSIVRV